MQLCDENKKIIVVEYKILHISEEMSLAADLSLEQSNKQLG